MAGTSHGKDKGPLPQKPRVVLSVMRAIEMTRVHPNTDFRRVCSRCFQPVAIFPSGQKVLREHKKRAIILCNHCVPSNQSWLPAPGSEHERLTSLTAKH